jgi:PqqD family protein of HPr-rel-A system
MTWEVRQRPVRRPGVWLRSVGGEHAVYDPSTKGLHLLNETARAIWELCDGQTTPDEMVRVICEVSGLPEEVVAEDLENTLTDFERLGILGWRG